MPHYAIVDDKGNLVSEASSIDSEAIASRGLVAHEVDGPQDGRPWDNAKKAWGVAPERVSRVKPVDKARSMYAAATTDTARIEALAVALGVKD